MIVDNGLEAIAARLENGAADLWNTIVWGTDGSTPTASDTSLGSPVASNTVSSTDYGGSMTTLIEGVLGTSAANGYTIAEIGTKNADGKLIDRAADFTTIDKTDQKVIYLEMEVEVT